MRSPSIAPILFAAVATLALAGCSGGSSTGGSGTLLHNIGIASGEVTQGVTIEVRRAPTTPGARPGTDASAPLGGAHIRVLRDGDVVGDMMADEQGHIGAQLEPGTYTLQPLPPATSEWPKPPAPVTLVVPSRGKASAILVYDTGIR